MKCQDCGNIIPTMAGGTPGTCWPCNDRKILERWHKPNIRKACEFINELVQNELTLEQPSYFSPMSNEEVKRVDLNLTPTIPTKIEECLNNYSQSLTNLKTTLPTDSAERKNYPLFRGLLRYFPAALAGVSNTSQRGNDKHNPGKELHHARSKSGDHADCILRHLMDLTDLLAARDRGAEVSDDQIKDEVNSMVWRALAMSQELQESLGAPLAPGAKE